jgi:hypothetical protein
MISAEQLFRGVELQPGQASIPPNTGVIGHYVLEQLPGDNTLVREGGTDFKWLAEQHSGLLEEAGDDVLHNSDPKKAPFDQLDLLFLLGSYLPDSMVNGYRNVPPKLLALIRTNAERFDLPNRMTYELIIDRNSEGFAQHGVMRQFTEGEQGLFERDFYYGHALAEPLVQHTYGALRTVLELGDHVDVDAILTEANISMAEFATRMNHYGRLPRENFGALRPYLAMYPEGVRNASGAFMPSVQQLELVLFPSTKLYPQYAVFLEESMPYFPRRSQPLIKADRERSEAGANVEDALVSGDLKLNGDQKALLEGIVESFRRFRASHIAITAKQVNEPHSQEKAISVTSRRELRDFGQRDIMEGEGLMGTAGFNAQNVLGNAVNRMENLKDRLKDGAGD